MVYISALISEYFGMTIKIYLSVIANDHGKEFFTVTIYVVAILYCILLCYIMAQQHYYLPPTAALS